MKEIETDTHIPKRRGSMTCDWDHSEEVPDEEAVPSAESDGVGAGVVQSMLDAAGHNRHGPAPSTFSSRSSRSGPDGDDLDYESSTSIAKRLQRQNPNFASVNQAVDQQLAKLMDPVTKKQGSPLTSDTNEIQTDLSRVPSTKEQTTAYQTLSSVPPFSYLPKDELKRLVLDLHKVEYTDGEVIVGQNETDDDVYILAQGRVVMVRLHHATNHDASSSKSSRNLVGNSGAKFVGYMDAPAYFGEFGTLFDAARTAQVMAGSPAPDPTIVYRLTGERFQSLVAQHSAFRLKLALGLRQHGIFRHIDSFIAIVRRAVARDQLFDFRTILESYRKMVPAIHANLHSSECDIEGWTYAVRRLPDTITSTYVYLLASHIPMPFQDRNFDLHAVQVPTAARRRQAFALDDHGKLLVIMRESDSDVLDFLSLLCAHIHESGKLRTKLVRPSALHLIHSCLWVPTSEDEMSASTKPSPGTGPTRPGIRSYKTASLKEQKDAIEKLPLTKSEKEGLQMIWPDNFLYRIWDIISLHENIQIRSDLASASVTSTDRWAESIRKAVNELLCPCQTDGQGDVCLLTEVTSHIISSNTTSVRNLLSPYILKNKQTIKDWGTEKHPEIMAHDSLSDSDKLCALCNAYMKSHPQARRDQDSFDQKSFKTLRNTEMTGIQVELIDLNALEETYIDHDIAPDPFLAPCFRRYSSEHGWTTKTKNSSDTSSKKQKGRLLVNIDYAFAKQAEQLISALSLLFEQSLSSVGVMGKAGGLQGERGDIIVADYLVHQEGDEQTLIDNTGVDREALRSLSGRTVHSGGVLTVLGTLLQDTRLLNFYKKLYGCVSLEMEGSFYARELRRFKKAGLLSSDVHLRFLYYISDTPLSTGADETATLSKDMSIAELIPPQYAVTRGLLRPVLSDYS